MTQIVYILLNEAMPDYIKIGHTTKDLEKRIKELDNTSVPMPFQCFYAAEVKDARHIERKLYKVFKDKRTRPNREFFRIDPNQVKEAIEFVQIKEVTPKQEIANDAVDIVALKKYSTNIESRSKVLMKMLSIPVGSVLYFTKDNSVTCIVKEENLTIVEFEGQDMSLSAAALKALHSIGYKWLSARGGNFWTYKGETLTSMRLSIEG